MGDQWLLLKRGLYYRPNGCGYTGIRDHAGVYTHAEALAHVNPDSGVSMVGLEAAPEFTEACFDDLARQHLQAEIERLKAERDQYLKHSVEYGNQAEKLRAGLQRIADRPKDMPLRTRNDYEAGEKQAIEWAADVANDALTNEQSPPIKD